MSTIKTSVSDNSVTISEFIALKNTDDITYYNYSLVEYKDGIEMFITNLLYDYEDELGDLVTIVKLSPKEQIHYRYKPELLAYDLYKSTETAFILMMLNGIIDPKEFDFAYVKVIRPAQLSSILKKIDSNNKTYMNNNRTKLSTDLKNGTGNYIWTS